MKIFKIMVVTYILVNTSITIAGTFGAVSIPAPAFTEQNSQSSNQSGSYKGNESGTSRSFSGMMFAPVDLPHGSIVTSFKCGGQPKAGTLVKFSLRRNEPQQANVDMAVIQSAFSNVPPLIGNKPKGLAEYQFINTTSITSSRIDNSKYNYYIIASTIYPPFDTLGPELSGSWSPYSECNNSKNCTSVNFCNIGYGFADPDNGAGKVKLTDPAGIIN